MTLIDQQMAQAMNRMTIQERTRILEDVHGVADNNLNVEEESCFIRTKLNELEIEICDNISNDDKQAYEIAKVMNSHYVTNDSFRISFLRADSYRVRHAAYRIISYFDSKLELFGPNLLVTEITQRILSKDDINCLQSGFVHLLPGRDRAGRAWLVICPKISMNHNYMSKLRTMWYITSVALQDEESQLKGFVAVLYVVDQQEDPDRLTVWKAFKLFGSYPCRFVAVHLCADKKCEWIGSIATQVFESRTRSRVRCHFGTDMECIYELMTFGISEEMFPVTQSGQYRLEYHENFLQRQRTKEDRQIVPCGRGSTCTSTSSTSSSPPLPSPFPDHVQVHDDGDDDDEKVSFKTIIVVPNTFDVLLGRGRTYRLNPGNVRFHHLIETYFETYEQAKKNDKKSISDQVIQNIQQQGGGRFLELTDPGWVVVSDDIARIRVSHAFRNRRLTNKATTAATTAQSEASTTTTTTTSAKTTTAAATSVLSRPLEEETTSSKNPLSTMMMQPFGKRMKL